MVNLLLLFVSYKHALPKIIHKLRSVEARCCDRQAKQTPGAGRIDWRRTEMHDLNRQDFNIWCTYITISGPI